MIKRFALCLATPLFIVGCIDAFLSPFSQLSESAVSNLAVGGLLTLAIGYFFSWFYLSKGKGFYGTTAFSDTPPGDLTLSEVCTLQDRDRYQVLDAVLFSIAIKGVIRFEIKLLNSGEDTIGISGVVLNSDRRCQDSLKHDEYLLAKRIQQQKSRCLWIDDFEIQKHFDTLSQYLNSSWHQGFLMPLYHRDSWVIWTGLVFQSMIISVIACYWGNGDVAKMLSGLLVYGVTTCISGCVFILIGWALYKLTTGIIKKPKDESIVLVIMVWLMAIGAVFFSFDSLDSDIGSLRLDGIIAIHLLTPLHVLAFILLKRPTPSMLNYQHQIASFRHYLSDESPENNNRHNSPFLAGDDVFERYLPYALAFNLEGIWCRRFELFCRQRGYYPAIFSWYPDTTESLLRDFCFRSLSQKVREASPAIMKEAMAQIAE